MRNLFRSLSRAPLFDAAGIFLVCALTVACGDPRGTEPSASSSEALVDGRVTEERPEIGYVSLPTGGCSGTLIAPNAVLSAAHCFNYQSGATSGSFRIGS